MMIFSLQTMSSNHAAASISARMAKVRQKGTAPELVVRRLVHGMRYRYRLHRKDLPGKPDLVFPSRRKVIFVHGCFWHGHHCRAGRNRPASNRAYWEAKLNGNHQRDAKNVVALEAAGWKILVLWECQIKNRLETIERIRHFLNNLKEGQSR
jgi:DNA mismatch endonuclease, patch repair protein